MLLFLADECCDASIVRTLRTLGYDVTYIAEFSPSEEDESVLDRSYREKRILIHHKLKIREGGSII